MKAVSANRCGVRLAAIALLALAILPAAARAESPGMPTLSFSGFGTFGEVHSSERRADFTSSLFKPNGAGFTHTWSMDVDTLIAGQVTANFTPELSAVLQVISEQAYDNTYRPHVEWANIKYQITPDLDLRGGRIVLPVFMVSDFRKVGYANAWVRPPIEVYGLVPVTFSDGIDASYRLHFGDVTNTVQASYGSTTSKAPPDGSTVKANNQWGIFNTVEFGNLTLHIHYHQVDLDLPGPRPFFDAFRLFGPEGNAIANKYDCNGKTVRLTGFGARYDPGRWFLMGEWAKNVSHCFIGSQTAWYVSGGYRLRDFTPYVTYAAVSMDSATSDPGLNIATVSPLLTGAAIGLNAGLNGIIASTARRTLSVGARWDFMHNVDLKVQYDHMSLDAGSHGNLINLQRDYRPGGKVNVFSATIDFVF